jgi:hypothetical protein
LTIAWSRLAIARSGSGISAIFASRTFSPSARRASAFSSLARSSIAARFSAVNPFDCLVAALRFVDFCVRKPSTGGRGTVRRGLSQPGAAEPSIAPRAPSCDVGWTACARLLSEPG